MADVIRALSASHVMRLTGLSHRQLDYWDQTGFFSPQFAFENRHTPFSRVYSFRDVIGLRTIAILRKQHHISLQELRKVAKTLSEYHERPWSELTLYVTGKRVYFREPDTEAIREVLSGQYTYLRLRSIIEDLTEAAKKLKQRSQEQFGQIERHRYVVHNAYVLAGTRIPTRTIWRFHNAGFTHDHIIREYPILTAPDIDAAIHHEQKLVKRARA
jgi:DNA-binding transcriptional MerR regulator